MIIKENSIYAPNVKIIDGLPVLTNFSIVGGGGSGRGYEGSNRSEYVGITPGSGGPGASSFPMKLMSKL